MKKLLGPSQPKPPPGQRGKKRHPEAVSGSEEHQWTRDARPRGQPAWLDAADGRLKCAKCGVEKKLDEVGYHPGPSGNINADHAGFGDDGRRLMKGKKAQQIYSYIDAKGRTFQTTQELGCPAFILDEYGAIRENRQMVRLVDDRVDYVDDRVDDVVDRTDTLEDRIIELERQNAALQAKVNQPIDMTAMVDWLAEMVALAVQQKMEMVPVHVEGRPVAALPPPVADMIIDLGSVGAQEVVEPRSEEAHEIVEDEDP